MARRGASAGARSGFGERAQMRGASLQEPAEIAIEVNVLDEPSDRAEGCAIADEIAHHGRAIATGEFVAVPEAGERAGDLLVLEAARRVVLDDLRRQPLAHTEVPRLPRHHIARSEQG